MMKSRGFTPLEMRTPHDHNNRRGNTKAGQFCDRRRCARFLTGFTLLELIVAIGIIMTGILAVFGLFLQSSKTQRAQEGEGLALDLAQEGIEVVRSIRDSNWLAGCPERNQPPTLYAWEQGGCFLWDSGLFQNDDGRGIVLFDDQKNSWSLDWTAADAVADNGAALVVLDSGVITHKHAGTAGRIKTNLPLQRLMTLQPICRDATQTETMIEPGKSCLNGTRIGFHVTATVRWNAGSGYEERSIEDRLYNWR